VLPLNILLVIKSYGMENLEKPGSSNLSYLTLLPKKTMLIKELLDTELEKMSKIIKHSESVLTLISENILFMLIQALSFQILQEFSSLTLSPFSYIVGVFLQTQANAVTPSITSSTTSVVLSTTVIEVDTFVLIPMENMF